MPKILADGVSFIRRQPREWKITVARTSVHRLFYQMIVPYLSVYIFALGAEGTELGFVNAVGMAAAGLLGPFLGWFVDRTGVKKIYLGGIALLALSYLVYGIADSWKVIIIAMMFYWLGMTSSMQSCSVICGNSLVNEDRVTAMSCCETFAAGLLGMLGPMLGAMLVSGFGGINVEGIRPLFFVAFAGTLLTFLFILLALPDIRWGEPSNNRPNFLKDMSQVFEQGRYLKRWIMISSINSLPIGMVLPFTQVWAREYKGADEYVLGAMVTGMALIPLVFGIIMGRLADRIGRKKVLYITMPIFWVSQLMLIWAPNHALLIAAGSLAGFFHIIAVTSGAIGYELVPKNHMGRWMGTLRFFRGIFGATAIFMGGLIWDYVGPQFVFLTIIALDLFVRLPLLVGMPETLSLETGTRSYGS
ncbi:MAG: MFS transporter [Deltaproteobacteria bacterium]|nr:MFS transporter [Deltaproteobacteria bacterium]